MGIGAGIISAVKRYSFWDILVTLVTSVLVAVPAFWLGMLLQLFFGVQLHVLPISGAGGTASQYQDWVHYILPAVTLASVSTAYCARIMRSQLLDVMNQDYIRTAKAKGLSQSGIIFKHAMRNAIMPVVTVLGPITAGILTGGFVVESVFGIPGLGKYFVQSIQGLDYTMICGTTVFYGAFLIVANLVVDIAYGLIDPRVKLEG